MALFTNFKSWPESAFLWDPKGGFWNTVFTSNPQLKSQISLWMNFTLSTFKLFETSLAKSIESSSTSIPTAIFAIIVYFKNKQIDYKSAFKIILWGIVPTVVASYVANVINTNSLRKIFAMYLISIGIAILVKNFNKS